MNTPQHLQYAASHEWILIENGKAKIGLTDHAQDALGDIVFISLPEMGDRLAAGDTACDVESVKAVSDVYCPIGGVVTAVNESLVDAPESINQDPYGAWIFELEDISGESELLDAAAYIAFCECEA